ncbi:DUF4240 domain-containing protein [Dactylosporangium sp. NPDC049525]|uniref:DUF4240 domain-containing protein n=1 Tax=Dactylosporangium sp. NPDC049525 TaxID=3154730 RepID=UPI003435897B
MDEDGFWHLIDQVDDRDRAGAGRITSVLVPRLARLPVPQIADFHTLLVRQCDRLLSWELWEAAEIILRMPVSEDSFYGFRPWIVAQGRQTFDEVLDDPDLLAEHPKIVRLAGLPGMWSNADFPEAEELIGVGELAFDRVLAKLAPRYAARVEWPAAFDRRPRGIPDAAPPPKFGDAQRLGKLYPWLVELFP